MANCSKNSAPTVEYLRHAEYYDMQKVFDKLYAKSKNCEMFEDLMSIILSKENILLAYRNIKRNTGSKTAGTDGLTMADIEKLTPEEVVDTVIQKVTNRQGYKPRPVRRKEIPKPNGEKRPLGIPCIWDRLIQQCIKQVLEPICEAKFSNHSYGFRPGRSVKHAVAETNNLLNLSKDYFVVELDIKGFFDNVNHSKLIKQIWAMGIHDKHLIYVLKQILSAKIKLESGEYITPKKGTPQGGIISPLLANIVLNELDHWIESQWEENPIVYSVKVYSNRNGSENKGFGYKKLRKTRLKEMRIVRYADDVRIFCKTKNQACRTLMAVTDWLESRLKLEVSKEKTRIVNAKRKRMEFLGFIFKVRPKANKLVVVSHISAKAKKRVKEELKKQVKKIAKTADKSGALKQTLLYNIKVEGIQNYYCWATCISKDFADVQRDIGKILKNRLRRDRLSKTKGRELSKHERERYGRSEQMRYDKATGSPIYPIGYVQNKHSKSIRHGLTPYTPEGRNMMQNELEIDKKLMHELMRKPVLNRSIEYADNRISLFSAQRGKCAITGRAFLSTEEINCHHKKPLQAGGDDSYRNLILIHVDVHKLIHAKDMATIQKYLSKLNLNKKQLDKVNALRTEANMAVITL